MTASCEEGAAFSSLLARGVRIEDEKLRLRYETPWRAMTTRARAIQRLEESCRIRLAYLDAWPGEPHLAVYRTMSAPFTERYGAMNAPAAYLLGLMHEDKHREQMRNVLHQARLATSA